MTNSRAITTRTRSPLASAIRVGFCLILASLIGRATAAHADFVRVQTQRSTFLIEVNDNDVTVRADGEDLVVTRTCGDEVRLRLDSDGPDRTTREPILTIKRDGKVIVSARRLANVATAPSAEVPGRSILNPKGLSSAWCLTLTPDNTTLVSSHRGFIRVWDANKLTERFNVPIEKVGRRVSITPDGSTIATAEYTQADGKTMGNVTIRDGKTGVARRVMAPVLSLHGVAIDPTGKVAVSTSWSESIIRVWDVETGEQVGTLKGHTSSVGSLVYSPDGKTLASGGDDTVRLWDVETGEVRRIFRGHQGGVESVAFSADGKILATGSFDEDAKVWDVATGNVLATIECDNPVLAVALTPDGKTIATASARWGNGFYGGSPAKVQVWDVASRTQLATLPDQPAQVFSMIFKADGKSLFTASLSGAVTLWDLDKFKVEVKPR